jgi:two-component system chemotaxis sensor kinase CheA
MDAKDQEFLKRLQAIFRMEADEHLRAISAGLIDLEKTPEPARRAELIESIFRETHSLKGAARSVNLRDIESICQPLESALAALKRGGMALSPALFDLFHQAVDRIAGLVPSAEGEPAQADQARVRELIRQLGDAAKTAPPPARPEEPTPVAEALPVELAPLPSQEAQDAPRPPAGERPMLVETVRIPTAKLAPLLLEAEEMIQAKLAGSQRAAELREIQRALVSWKTERAKDQPAHQRDEFSEWNAAQLDTLIGQVTAVTQAFEQDQRALGRMVDEHLEATKHILMLPVSRLVEILPRLVRDLARDQGKEVELVVRGAEIEIDKRILDELKDPLIHLVRNCIDHGLERPEERVRKLKPAHGTILLTFSAKDSRQVEILVSDDGTGIDAERVRAAAVKMGVISAEAAERLSPPETWPLIFQSGLSTSRIITDVSGRGLGLSIVREKAEKLGGVVSVDSQTDVGATFRLLLPLTLATFRGILVRVRGQAFVLPTTHIERAVRVSQEEIKTVENRETIRLGGRILSLVGLGDVLGLPVGSDDLSRHPSAKVATTNYLPVLVLAFADQRIAVHVDEVLAEQEVLVKGLGKQLSRVRNVAGATVLGSGQVVPVLNVSDLMKSALRSVAAAPAPAAVEQAPARPGRVLVAEDSITARTLLKNILQTAGYQVATAVDGADALTQARSGEFDLIVSDVNMPRMNGFELTTRIRGDKKVGELPVVLVTALESREDRERGIEAGANAYIVKSSFDQSNLLEVIHRLL